eukprot:Skav219701  [mRNA]  locus=scaffold817:332681:334338:+ [translate_table: standard]
MPRSKRTPEGRKPNFFIMTFMELKGAWWIVKRGSACINFFPTAIASGSMSKAWSEPEGDIAASIALV